MLRLLLIFGLFVGVTSATAELGGATDEIQKTIGAFKGVMGVSAKNLATGEEIAINADLRFPTASTIKTAVMVEAYHQDAEGKLPLTAAVTLQDADKGRR